MIERTSSKQFCLHNQCLALFFLSFFPFLSFLVHCSYGLWLVQWCTLTIPSSHKMVIRSQTQDHLQSRCPNCNKIKIPTPPPQQMGHTVLQFVHKALPWPSVLITAPFGVSIGSSKFRVLYSLVCVSMNSSCFNASSPVVFQDLVIGESNLTINAKYSL